MPTRSSRRPLDSRAEARRRARALAQGSEADLGEEEEAAESAVAPSSPGGTFLSRLFPPAAPLPGKPDPLAGFTYNGPMRGLVSSLYILFWNPVPWLLPAAAWSVGRILTAMSAGVLQVLATIITFLALLGAGWLGWQRPWLFGLAASVVGTFIFALIWAILLGGLDLPDVNYTGVELFAVFTAQETFQWLFGILAGWYGGYLRRRMVTPPPSRNARRR